MESSRAFDPHLGFTASRRWLASIGTNQYYCRKWRDIEQCKSW